MARDSFAQGSIQQAQDRVQIADITGSILDKLTNGEPLDSDEKWVIAQIAAASLGGPTSMKSLKGSPALKRVAAKLGKPIKDFAKDESGGKKPTVDKTNPNPQNQINNNGGKDDVGAAATKGGVDLSKFSLQDRKSFTTLEKRIVEHEQKLADFKANPTVRPGMENQPPEVIRAAQERRILHLEREIAAFRKNQNDIVSKYD